MSDNFLIIVIVYGLLLLSDALMLNVFGFDGAAAQIYFVTPVPFKTVLKAKNLVAIAFVGLQMVAVFTIAAVMRLGMSWLNVANAVAASAVVSIFFLSAGNLISISIPRKIDPKQTFRKQSGGKLQLWFLLCSIGMLVLMGFAFLARWAVQTNWAFLGVLLVEFFVGLIVYYVATESAVEKGMRERERLVETLSRGSAPIGLGL